MNSSIREWLNLSVRWFHVFAGIMWVGQTYYFTWLDGQFGKLEKKAAANGTASAVWMVHSGGFYTVEKQESLGVAPEQVHWFLDSEKASAVHHPRSEEHTSEL